MKTVVKKSDWNCKLIRQSCLWNYISFLLQKNKNEVDFIIIIKLKIVSDFNLSYLFDHNMEALALNIAKFLSEI